MRLNALNRLNTLNSFGAKKSGISWGSYWSHQSEVLFFGLYSEISGGQMPNKVTGATDFLTVAGSAGSETYQCPNTAAYIAADTDKIWFKTDATQRTVTTAELIGYDLQRTPVKYLDNSPNSIEAIMILSSAVTGSKRDKMFTDFRLPIMWDNSWNDYGREKSNRPDTEQILWTPEAVVPDCLSDGNTIIWADFSQKVTKDGSNIVSVWADVLDNGQKFTAHGNPVWSSDGIALGNGNCMQSDAFANNYLTVYLVIKPLTWSLFARIFDGGVDGQSQMVDKGSTPNVAFGASGNAFSSEQTTFSLNNWHIVRVKYMGGNNCKGQIDDESIFTWNNVAYATMSAITIGGRYNFTGAATMILKEIILRKGSTETDQNFDDIKTYLKHKYGI